MKIEWNRVTRLSQIVAVVLFVGVFVWGFCLGTRFQTQKILGERVSQAKFVCPKGESLSANFYDRMVQLEFEGQTMYLPQTISASGARYANKDESFIFWNKGNSAFIERNGKIVLEDCVAN